MEAEIFQEISDAIQSRSNHIFMPIDNVSPIQKIVWSSFDYMAGPELRFVWEPSYSKQNISLNPNPHQGKNGQELATNVDNNDIETVDGCVSSSDSSFSKVSSSTARDQFEEIDTYNSDLLKLRAYDDVEISSKLDLQKFSQYGAPSSQSQTQSTLVYAEEESSNQSHSIISSDEKLPTTPLMNNVKEASVELGKPVQTEMQQCDGQTQEDDVSQHGNMVTSCVDSGIAGTISIDSNLSACINQESRDGVIYKAKDEFCNIRMERSRDFCGQNIHEAQEVIEFDHDAYSDTIGAEETLANLPTNRCSPQTPLIGNPIGASFYSYFSDSSPTKEKQFGSKFSREKAIVYREAEFLATELSTSESLSISDEAFIAKHVLAEQIGSIQLNTNPILHKFCIIPSRHIAFGSFIFSTREASQPITAAPNLSAFSLMVPLEMVEWYLERQPLFHEIISDIVARFKAAHLVEPVEDLICHCTREFAQLLTLFGALERWPLDRKELQRARIQSSHLWELRRDNIPNDAREFVVRCITATLICRGRCTVIGSNSNEVQQLMMTLSAFLEPAERIACLKPNKLQFSPYLRLQAIKRSEIYQFFEHAANAHWSSALVDIDRKSVIYTGLYHKHRIQKKSIQLFQISQIFREAMEAGLAVPTEILTALDQQLLNGPRIMNVLETHAVRADPAVFDFMDQIALLPLNRAARISFVDQFHLRMRNHAKSLISYIRDLSAPSPYDKRSALSSKWHLATVRRNLNLQQDSAYGIALAGAESLQPDFAEFIVQHTTAAGRHINH